jgi:hypothetical protein
VAEADRLAELEDGCHQVCAGDPHCSVRAGASLRPRNRPAVREDESGFPERSSERLAVLGGH